jgi:DNA-binding transcriptional LysR family regulator
MPLAASGRLSRFSLPQLEAFYWLAELGSFKAVSERLNLSQPAITTRIKELERELGTLLVDRQVGRSVPTAAGRALLKEARGIFEHVERIGRLARNSERRPIPIRLGLPDTLACLHLPALVAAIAETDARFQLSIEVDHSESLQRKLLQDGLDFAFVAGEAGGTAVEALPVCEVALRWAQASAGETLPSAEPRILAGRSVVAMPPPSNLHRYTMEWFAAAPPPTLTTCNSLPGIVGLIAGGLAVGIIPTALVQPLGHGGRISPIASNRALPPDRVHLAYRPNSTDRSHADLIAGCCTEVMTRNPHEGIRRLHA